MLNEFLKYDGCKVRYKLLKIETMIFGKEEAPSDFGKLFFKPFYNKGVKSKFGNYRDTSLVFVGSKLIAMIIIFRLNDFLYEVLGEEQCGFKKL